MLRARVAFTDYPDGSGGVTVTRPIAWLVLLALPMIILDFYERDYFSGVFWCFLYAVLWPRIFRETLLVSTSGVRSVKGLWRSSDVIEMPWNEISAVKVLSSKEPSKRGFVPTSPTLTLTYKKRFQRFLGGASVEDAEKVAGWIASKRLVQD